MTSLFGETIEPIAFIEYYLGKPTAYDDWLRQAFSFTQYGQLRVKATLKMFAPYLFC